jgi:DnaJ-domain-containing protein 1
MQQAQDTNLRLDRLAGAAADSARLYFPARELTASDNPTRARQAEVRLRNGGAQWLRRAPLPIHPCH